MTDPAIPTLTTLQSTVAGAVPVHHIGGLSQTTRALFILCKPRLACFSILSAMAAYAAVQNETGWFHLVVSLIGISLAAGGALSLNQWWERAIDAKMQRTADRPLPRGQVSSRLALTWSLALSLSSLLLLTVFINPLSALLAAATILLYGLVYTPLKRHTRWATEIGSISGALPPLLGAAAAGQVHTPVAWTLAAILLFWQMPHFYGIGWMYRQDYRNAGFPLLPATDPSGQRTANWSLGYTLGLGLVSLLPWFLGWFNWIYGTFALIGFAFLLARTLQFRNATDHRDPAARRMFLATVLYLPPILIALVIAVV